MPPHAKVRHMEASVKYQVLLPRVSLRLACNTVTPCGNNQAKMKAETRSEHDRFVYYPGVCSNTRNTLLCTTMC